MRLKHTIEATRIDEATMIDSLVVLIEKQLEKAETDYTQVLRNLTYSLRKISDVVKKDPRYGGDIGPELRAAVINKIVGEGDYPQEMIDIVLHFFGRE